MSAGRILVVDDEQRIRTGCREVLVSEGYAVELAESGAKAVEMIAGSADIHIIDALQGDGLRWQAAGIKGEI